MTVPAIGLRERKKLATRERIYETAWRLFTERGFERVTVADVARESQVALATVFNYFPSKEELFFGRLEEFGARLVDAVAVRSDGESLLDVFRNYLGATGGLMARVEAGDAEALDQVRMVNRLIADSEVLRVHERLTLARTADAIAELLAADSKRPTDRVRAQAVANALMGVHRALLDHARQRILSDDDPTGLAHDLRSASNDAFTLLERGIGEFGRRSSRAGPRSSRVDRPARTARR
ncbi:MAG TPA: TetR family transcriptional regulator [Micromonosporaceae bacterium]